MLYAILATDAEGSLQLRRQCRDRHINRLETLRDEGRLVIAGPHPRIDSPDPGPQGFSGSLVIAEFESQEEAERWAAADPYLEAGAWVDVEVKPFLATLP